VDIAEAMASRTFPGGRWCRLLHRYHSVPPAATAPLGRFILRPFPRTPALP